jgi:hypothetical protein
MSPHQQTYRAHPGALRPDTAKPPLGGRLHQFMIALSYKSATNHTAQAHQSGTQQHQRIRLRSLGNCERIQRDAAIIIGIDPISARIIEKVDVGAVGKTVRHSAKIKVLTSNRGIEQIVIIRKDSRRISTRRQQRTDRKTIRGPGDS